VVDGVVVVVVLKRDGEKKREEVGWGWG